MSAAGFCWVALGGAIVYTFSFKASDDDAFVTREMGAEIGAVVATEEAIADAAAGTTGVVVTAALVAVAAAGVVDDSTVLRLSVRSLAADAIDLNMSLILPSLLAILLLSKLVFYP